jgi:hypothetical protein
MNLVIIISMTDITNDIDWTKLNALALKFKDMYNKNLYGQLDLKCSTMDALAFVARQLSTLEDYDSIDDTSPREGFVHAVREHVLAAKEDVTYLEDDYVACIIDAMVDDKDLPALSPEEIELLESDKFGLKIYPFFRETWKQLILQPEGHITWTNRHRHADAIWPQLKVFVRTWLKAQVEA